VHQQYRIEAERKWNEARRRALWSRLLDTSRGDTSALIDFNEVAQRLHLKNSIFRGTQIVPLDKIVGSAGRYHDFNRAFLPINESMEERWRRVAALTLDPNGTGLPAIEVYKVGEWYFVKDGNHRVSVRRQIGEKDIEAFVWEYTDIPADIDPTKMDIDTFLIEAERADFLNHTGIDQIRTHHNIKLSTPGGYTDMLYRISGYQDVLRTIDNTEVTYPEAVAAWYDMIYESSVQIIEQEGILEMFPHRTAADLFVWSMRHRADLVEACEMNYTLTEAIDDIKRQQPTNPVSRAVSSIRRRLGGN
jgi:hypothetical protein